MNEERDSRLQALFQEAVKELPAEPFASRVMDAWEADRRRARWIEFAILFGIALLAVLFFEQITDVVLILSGTSYPLIDLRDEVVGSFVAPLNSLGGVLAIIMLGLRFLLRRMSA
jgi:hypothetical protein